MPAIIFYRFFTLDCRISKNFNKNTAVKERLSNMRNTIGNSVDLK